MVRTYAVTGAASGIGLATSELLRERGARVIGIDIHSADVVVDLSTTEAAPSWSPRSPSCRAARSTRSSPTPASRRPPPRPSR